MMAHATLILWPDRKLGDLGLVWGDDPLSHAIEALEGYAGEGARPPSHAFIVGPSGGVCLEAVWPKVRETPASDYAFAAQFGKVELYRLNDVSAGALLRAYNAMRTKYLGTWFNVLGIIGFIGVELGRHFHARILNWLAGKRLVWCSRMAAECTDLAYGYKPLSPRYTDPAGLLNWLRR